MLQFLINKMYTDGIAISYCWRFWCKFQPCRLEYAWVMTLWLNACKFNHRRIVYKCSITHLLLPSTVTWKLLIIQASYYRITKLRAHIAQKCKKLNIRNCRVFADQVTYLKVYHWLYNWSTLMQLPYHIIKSQNIIFHAVIAHWGCIA